MPSLTVADRGLREGMLLRMIRADFNAHRNETRFLTLLAPT